MNKLEIDKMLVQLNAIKEFIDIKMNDLEYMSSMSPQKFHKYSMMQLFAMYLMSDLEKNVTKTKIEEAQKFINESILFAKKEVRVKRNLDLKNIGINYE